MWKKFYSHKICRIGVPILYLVLLLITGVNYFHRYSPSYKSPLLLIEMGLIVIVMIVNFFYARQYAKKIKIIFKVLTVFDQDLFIKIIEAVV